MPQIDFTTYSGTSSYLLLFYFAYYGFLMLTFFPIAINFLKIEKYSKLSIIFYCFNLNLPKWESSLKNLSLNCSRILFF